MHILNQKRVIRALIAVLVSYIVVSLFISYINKNMRGPVEILDDKISLTVNKADGQTEEYDSNYLNLVNRGDTVIVTVPLEADKKIENSCLCFKVYHCIVTVSYGDQVLYTYGKEIEEKGRMIGGIGPRVVIPNEAWGESLQVKLELTENEAFSKLENIMIMSATNSMGYYYAGKEVQFVLTMGLAFLSSLSFIALILIRKNSSIIRQGIYMNAFCGGIAMWIISYNDMYNVFSSNVRYFATVEYVVLFLSPIPFILYMYEQEISKKAKRILRIEVCYFSVFFLITTVLNYTTRNYHYAVFLKYLHISMLLGLVIIIIIFLKNNTDRCISNKILRYGIYMSIGLLFLDVLRFNLDKYLQSRIALLSVSLSPVAVSAFLISLVVSYGVQFAQIYIGKREKEQLERMAYVDILTGIGNRAGCFKQLEELSKNKKIKYGIVFFDLNNLKRANDEYGHGMGDKLIHFFADSLGETFGNIGYCGRLGGDEFLAIVQGKKVHEIELTIEEIQNKLRSANKKALFPFEVSVAYGVAYNNEDKTQSVEEVLKEADKRMYERKKYMREMKRCM